MRPLDLLAVVAIMMIWGLNFAVAKIGLTELPPIFMMALRFSAVALLLCPVYRIPRRSWLGVLGLAIVLGGCHFSLMFSGLSRLDAATSAILIQIQVPFAALLAAYFYRDTLGWRRLLGMAMAFLGVILIVGEPRIGADMSGVFLVLTASFFWAVANIQIKRLGEIDSMGLTGWMAIFAAPQLFLASSVLEHGQLAALAAAGWRTYGAIAYMAGFVSIVSYALWYPLMRRYPVNQIMPFTLLVPVFGVLSGVLLLNERLGWNVILGGVATILGVGIIVLRRPNLPEPRNVSPT